eukprot:15397710-Alexandrium_andersonii.AAC.1
MTHVDGAEVHRNKEFFLVDMGLGVEQQQLSVGWALPDRTPACQCSARARCRASRCGVYGGPVPLEHPCGRG